METLFGIVIFVLIAGALAFFSRNVWINNAFTSSELVMF